MTGANAPGLAPQHEKEVRAGHLYSLNCREGVLSETRIHPVVAALCGILLAEQEKLAELP